MRCLALAEAWQDAGGGVFFVSVCDAPAIEERLKREGMPVFHIRQEAGTSGDADETARIAHDQGAYWIVVDGYQFGADYQKTIKDAGLSLLFIDDYGHADHYYADLVLNQNIYANMSFYKNYEPYTRFLLGTNYVLLRREFLKYSDWHRDIPKVARKILVTLGGSDPDNVTLKVIDAIKNIELEKLEVKVIIGGANPHFDLLHETVKDLSNFTLIINADSMPELMAWADVAISAGGSTCWELLFMALPSLVISIAENQDTVVSELDSRSIAKKINGNVLRKPEELARIVSDFLHDFDQRSAFSKRLVRSNNRNGSARIISAMHCPAEITFRTVELSDCNQIWLWINDPLIRSVSFDTRSIPLDRHKEWFSSAISDPDLIYYIVLDTNAKPFGQARFKIKSKEAIISVLIDPHYRGRSLGSLVIRGATEKFFAETQIDTVKAYIKPENEISRKAFSKAGYVEQGLCDYNGNLAHLLIKNRGT